MLDRSKPGQAHLCGLLCQRVVVLIGCAIVCLGIYKELHREECCNEIVADRLRIGSATIADHMDSEIGGQGGGRFDNIDSAEEKEKESYLKARV